MEWKDATYKKGDRNSASNCRTVVLTCVVCKIREHINHSLVMKHLDELNILTDKQHGFRRRRSCESQLIPTFEGIASKFRTGRDQVDIILLDFANAFDKAPTPPTGLLQNPRLYIDLDQRISEWPVSTSGSRRLEILTERSTLWSVPGNTMGPLLLLAFINDLPEEVKTSDARLFADDYLLYRHIRNDKDSSDPEADLSALEEARWRMRFHPGKCTVIRDYTNKRLRKNTSYKLHEHTLDVVDYSKYLSVFFFFFFFFSYLIVTPLFSPSIDTQRVGEDHPSVYLTNYKFCVIKKCILSSSIIFHTLYMY